MLKRLLIAMMRLVNKHRNQISASLFIALMAVVVFASYQLGTLRPRVIIVKGVDNIQNDKIQNTDFGVYWRVWDLIKHNYLKADKLNNQDLVYGSAAGLASSLGDPYTVFFKPDEAKQFADDIKGSFGGIGIEIGVRGDYVVVISPLKGSPAEKAGLKSGDKILAVDGKAISNLGLNKVVKDIRGPLGTEVKLTILSNGAKKAREVEMTRGKIEIPTVKWELRAGKIAHLQMFNFNENANRAFARAMNEALRAGARGLVLDLRNNPGGFLEIAVSIAGVFVDSGKEIVAEEFASGKRNSFKAHGDPVLKKFPLVILVNGGSASASEILAGALRYHTKALIVGEKTFGKGTVQELKQLSDGSSLKITVAHWVLPDGVVIEGNGIEPDVKIKMSEEDVEKGQDPQLKKALEILSKKINS